LDEPWQGQTIAVILRRTKAGDLCVSRAGQCRFCWYPNATGRKNRGITAATGAAGSTHADGGAIAVDVPGQLVGEPSLAEAAQAVPLPARRPPDAALFAVQRLARVARLPNIITGVQPILPPDFSAYADMDR
jgi:hypothetical protein